MNQLTYGKSPMFNGYFWHNQRLLLVAKSQELNEAAGEDHRQRGEGDPLHRPPEHELVALEEQRD